jgi:hypothetical protein
MVGEINQYQMEGGAAVIHLHVRGGNMCLSPADKVAAEAAFEKVNVEYDSCDERAESARCAVEQHFVEATAKVKQIEVVKSVATLKGNGGRT